MTLREELDALDKAAGPSAVVGGHCGNLPNSTMEYVTFLVDRHRTGQLVPLPEVEELDQKAADQINAECMHGEYETAHEDADNILVETLESLGFHRTVEAWKGVGKWYA